MVAAKGTWVVTAGVILGEPIDKFTKRFNYTSLDYEKDSRIREPEAVSIFSQQRALALDYYFQVSQPALNNWATIQFIWY